MDIIDKISTSPTDRSIMLQSSLSSIPESEKKEDWIEILDYNTKKNIYSLECTF